MLWRSGFDLSRNAVKAFLEEHSERPSSAITGKHIEIVDVKIAVTVGLTDFRVVHM